MKKAAWVALAHWMKSPGYKNRPTSYHDQVAPLIFPGVFAPQEDGYADYGQAKNNLCSIWEYLGWVHTRFSNKGWSTVALGDLSEGSRATYRSMACSNDASTRERGLALLGGNASPRKSYKMIWISTGPVVEHLLASYSPLSFLGVPKSRLAEQFGIPLPIVKAIWDHLIATGLYAEYMGRVDGSRQRVLRRKTGGAQ